MAITRAQQFRQMLEDGGMLVQPGFGGKRQGYRSERTQEQKEKDVERATQQQESYESAAFDPGPNSPPSVNRPSFPTGDDQDSDAIEMALAMQDQDFKGRRVVKGKTDLRTRPDKLEDLKEKLRKFKDRRNKVNIPGIGFSKGLQGIAQAFSDFGAKFNRPFFERVIAAERIPGLDLSTIQNMSEDEIEEAYKSYMADRLAGKTDAMGNLKPGFMRDASGNIISTGNDGREDPIIPIIPKPIEQEEVEQIARNFGGLPARITGSLFDFTGMADGGRIGAMGGGMMDLDSARQMMFLGGIAKSISKGLKGVTRAAKKVFKSPVGKAALLGLGAYYAPGIGIKATGGFSNLTQPGGFLSTLLTKGGDKALNLDNLSGLKIAGLLTAAPFLFSSDEEEEDKPTDMGPTLTMEELLAIRANPFKYLTPRIAGSQFAAEGGRIGFQEGGGIEARLEQLGGDVSSAEQMLQSINQRLKTAESSLGSGGGLGGLPGASGPLSGLPGAGGPKIDEAFFGNTSLAALSQRPVPESMQSKPQNLGPLQSVQQSKSFDNMSPAEKVKLAQGRLTQKDMKTPEMLEFFQNIIKTKGLTDMQMPAGPSLSSLTSSSGNLGIPASGYAKGGDVEPVAKKVMPLLDMGGKEMDLRDNGGFVPIGRMEKADDVPARLSKNEFVFTADAVRNAGDGDVDKGAEVMYNMMKNLERGGNVSDESQGLEGAREMFQTAQRLGEVV